MIRGCWNNGGPLADDLGVGLVICERLRRRPESPVH
ncbi:hypothetical protein CSHISOI_10888 [Colletotrichum shisoi]|uniref:Uncharacterized protein n=1 Tax=Colletotrichum shisoi TaxID=2078593 RepID=A0A5Q4BCA7_9PEZI|nr:hypothetical protein CSHISOI_10888 [Colletotrichum shisoi]